MKKKYFAFTIFVFLILGCSHKQVKKTESEVSMIITLDQEKIIKPNIDYRKLMIETYNKLILSIKKRNFDDILSCYANNSVYGYTDTNSLILKCFDGSYEIIGVENIKKQYEYLFKKRLLDNIEFEIIKIDEANFIMKIINLWANDDYGVYEYLHFILEDDKYMNIIKHYVVKEEIGRQG